MLTVRERHPAPALLSVDVNEQRSGLRRRERDERLLRRLRPLLVDGAQRAGLDPDTTDALDARLVRRLPDAAEALEFVYGAAHDVGDLLEDLLEVVVAAVAARPVPLRRLDRRREIDPTWYLSERMVGYVCYADRFGGDLAGVADHIDHLEALGVTYLHLMPLLAPRQGPNDGGYAVVDYRAVDPRLGTMDDLDELAAALRRRGISLCVDVVVNHTAAEHDWAGRARAGEERYRDYYLTFPDRELPDRYERTVRDVFPDTAPGSFTWDEQLQRWVWTSFHPWQWDLDYTNPAVLTEMLAIMLNLANRGAEVLRLDAVPFMWKRLGTDCQNQPEAHRIVQAWRALLAVAAPAVMCKAEAIVPPGELVQYLGAHEVWREECQLAYHNQLMVMLWSSAATRDARLATTALSRMRTPPSITTWATYVRGHDDIGWAVDDGDAAAVGWDGASHRRFLADFFAGRFPGSFAEGVMFQEDPRTGDARTCGSAAALAGLDRGRALQDEELVDEGIRRLLLLYGVALGWEGVPLFWMGDEVGLANDWSYREDPAEASDSRFVQRPRMDWDRVARRHQSGTVEQRVFDGLRRLVTARASVPALRGGAVVRPLANDQPAVLSWLRVHPRRGRMLGLANFGESSVTVTADLLGEAELAYSWDALTADGRYDLDAGRIGLPGLAVRWLVGE